MKIVNNNCVEHIFKKLNEKFINDKDILNIAVKKNSLIIKYTSEAIKDDKNIALEDDKDIVLTAVKQSDIALEIASNRLKNDEEIIMVAIRRDDMAIKYASNRLKKIISLT